MARGLAAMCVAAGSAGRQPPMARHVVAPSSVYQTPPDAAAAYARRPVLGSTQTSRTRPVTLGVSRRMPTHHGRGPMGCHRSVPEPGAALATAFRGRRRPRAGASSSGAGSRSPPW